MALAIEYYGAEGALLLCDRLELQRLQAVIHQSWEMRRDPKERSDERRAKASAALNDWLHKKDLNSIILTSEGQDGKIKTLTLEQINNFEF